MSALLCVVAIPSMYANVVDHNGFYNPAGWGATIVANVPPLIWFLVTSLAMIRKRERTSTLHERSFTGEKDEASSDALRE